MKKLLLPFFLFLSQSNYAQQKQNRSDLEKLDDCILKKTSYFIFNGDQPTGTGWAAMEQMFADNQFVAWGEYHNSPTLSRLTAAAMKSAAKQGYNTLCVETSPAVAKEIKNISRIPDPADSLEKIYRKGYPGIGVFPFFHTKEDAEILLAANAFDYEIWGVDQEFQMSFPFWMERIFTAQPKKNQNKFKGVYDSLQARWWYPESALLDSLKHTVRQKQFRTIIEDIAISKEIYRYNNNEDRARLMKRNFFNYYNNATKPRKVFFKLGANHLAKGINLQTQVYDLGNSIYELAQRNNTGFANIYLMVRYTNEKGAVIDDFNAENNENPKVFSRLYDKEKWVLVDIRALRTRLTHDNSLPRDAYAILEKYDYVLISPEVLIL